MTYSFFFKPVFILSLASLKCKIRTYTRERALAFVKKRKPVVIVDNRRKTCFKSCQHIYLSSLFSFERETNKQKKKIYWSLRFDSVHCMHLPWQHGNQNIDEQSNAFSIGIAISNTRIKWYMRQRDCKLKAHHVSNQIKVFTI